MEAGQSSRDGLMAAWTSRGAGGSTEWCVYVTVTRIYLVIVIISVKCAPLVILPAGFRGRVGRALDG